MSILIEKAGILTTVQDLGRTGYRRFGVNPNGVMDATAARLINVLLGNDEDEAVLEMHFPAPQILFQADTVFAIGGADLSARLDGNKIDNWQTHVAKKGSSLAFDKKVSGSRAYLAVGGGFQIKQWLQSASTNLMAEIGGVEGRKLRPGDRIGFCESVKGASVTTRRVSPSLIPFYSAFPTVRITAGAEFDSLTNSSRESLVNTNFVVSNNSSRMGFRLTSAPLALSEPTELISTAVDFGTIQLLPDGQVIVLMADHQTCGGYPRIAHIMRIDLPLLAQLGTNDKVAFHLVEHKEAEDLSLAFETELNFLKTAVRFTPN